MKIYKIYTVHVLDMFNGKHIYIWRVRPLLKCVCYKVESWGTPPSTKWSSHSGGWNMCFDVFFLGGGSWICIWSTCPFKQLSYYIYIHISPNRVTQIPSWDSLQIYTLEMDDWKTFLLRRTLCLCRVISPKFIPETGRRNKNSLWRCHGKEV